MNEGAANHPTAPHGTKLYVYLLARKSFRWVIIGFKPHGIKIYVFYILYIYIYISTIVVVVVDMNSASVGTPRQVEKELYEITRRYLF